MKTQNKTIKVMSVDCIKCGKNISGYSESQVLYNLKLHLDAHETNNKQKRAPSSNTDKASQSHPLVSQKEVTK
jgi:hypothetical protein